MEATEEDRNGVNVEEEVASTKTDDLDPMRSGSQPLVAQE